MAEDEEYVSPFKKETKVKVAHPGGEYAHENYPGIENAVDLIADAGTEVRAVKGGKVIIVKDRFGGTKEDKGKTWGLDKKYAKETNFVAIEHDDGTYSEYLHLGKSTAKVKEGDLIEAGTVLGELGYSGCMTQPHLHLNVVKIIGKKPVSIMPKALEKVLKKFKGYEKKG